MDLRVVEKEAPVNLRPLLLGESGAIEQLRLDIKSVSRSDAKVLIVGETGAGKEIVARMIHDGGPRCHRPFLAINCAGLPDSLLESELFGHVRGSFTGAYRDKSGLAMLADRGTLFLDELGEMSPRMQSVLLRFLETGEIHRLGSDAIEQRVNVRVIAATNRNLPERISTGDFREDLYYRLNVAHVIVPPLRERGSDILLLFKHYFHQYCVNQGVHTPALESATEQLLLAYRWPGNVRELKNVAERIAVRHTGGPVRPDVLPIELRIVTAPQAPVASASVCEPQPMARPAVEMAWDEMTVRGASFWTAVHAIYMDRGLTKADVRDVVRRGLKQTQGSYRKLTELFNLPPTDYKRLLAFLYQHDCHLAFHPFREAHLSKTADAGIPRVDSRQLAGAQ